MITKLRSMLITLSLIILVGLLALYTYIQTGNAETLFGDKKGTLPAIDFQTLEYPNEHVGYLLCPDDFCPAAQRDGPAPLFNVGAQKLRQALFDYIDQMPTIKVRKELLDIKNNQFTFTERMPGQYLPAVVTVRIFPESKYTSKMAIYSYQPLGDSDEYDHQARVERWVRHLSQAS